jgi:hypothetical protein
MHLAHHNQRARRSRRMSLLAASALSALPAFAFAADLPATPEGATKLSAVLEKYVGKPAAGAGPSVTVTPEGGHYTLAIDLAALTAPMKTSGFSYDPAILKYVLTEQDDGLWRFEHSAFPPLSFHMKDGSGTINLTDYKSAGIFDPAISWYKTIKGGLAGGHFQVKAPGVDEAFDLGAASFTGTGAALANGAVSGAVHEDIGTIAGTFTITPGGADVKPDAKPIKTNFHIDKGAVDVALEGLKPNPLLDLWAFAVAHPTRPELAANEAAFKDLLRAALPGAFKINETFTIGAISVDAAPGTFKAASGKGGVAAAGSGPSNSFEEHFAVDGLALPAGLIPPAYAALTPSAVDIGFKVSGFDLQAGANEAINDMHLAGDGPVISTDDDAKVGAKFKGAGPIVVEIAPSHILAPQLDIAFEGKINWDGARPSGTVTVHVRNFDKTVAALKALGPAASPQMLAGLTMAKGLAKTDADGALTWVGEMGADGAMKVNGLPLGKAPM